MDLSHAQRVRMLYKTILKLHRSLPVELQMMGNSYTREEFKRHRTCNVAEAKVFMVEWANYAVVLAEQLGLKRPKNLKELGQDLHPKKLDQMRNDQIVQLYELFEAAKNINQEGVHKEND